MSPSQPHPPDGLPADAERPRPSEEILAAAPVAHPEVRFEPTDISLRGVLVVLAVAACMLPLLQCLVMLLLRGEEHRQEERTASSIRPTSQTSAGLPAEPRLEQLNRAASVATSNVYRLEAVDEATLHSYGQTEDAGFVHVPIDWAIQRAADRLPMRKENGRFNGSTAEPVKDQGLLDAGEPNSGRILRGNSP